MTEKSGKIERIPISKLKLAPEHTEVFAHFKREYEALKRRIRVEGFDENYPLIVRKTKGKYEILCGVGRYEFVKDPRNQEAMAKRASSGLLCEVVDLTSDEAIILILKDNFLTCRAITGFTALQYFLLGMLLHRSGSTKYSKEDFKDHIMAELNIQKTKFFYFDKALDLILQNLKEEKSTDE